MKRIKFMLVAAISLAACAGTPTSPGTGDDTNPGSNGSDMGSNQGDEYDQALAARVVDYNAALKIASLKLTGDLPSLTEVQTVQNASDQKAAYEGLITDYMNRPTFAKQMFYFYRDTFKIGETAEFDTAPAFAAQIAATNGSYMNMFTAASGNCPTFDEASGVFTAAECTNGGPKAGVLTNPGVMKQFISNFAFRRTRWVQEMFACTMFPAEISATPTDVGGAAPYTGVWPFNSIASPTNGGGRVNFQDTSAVICANCHTTINHIAPLFAYYDAAGTFQTAMAVPTPLDGAPPAVMTDYLPAGEATAWRLNKPAADLPALGAQMASDPAVAECGVARIWNMALGKTDIVDTLQVVPSETIATQVASFTSSGFKMKDLIFAVFTSDDFVKF